MMFKVEQRHVDSDLRVAIALENENYVCWPKGQERKGRLSTITTRCRQAVAGRGR